MLYFENVYFSKGIPAAANILRIRDYPLHAHENIMEIVLVLRGTLSVMVSFERFKLKAGDYIVINSEDSHQMTGDAENITALLSFDLLALEPACRYATTVVFACESFDLAKYKKQETLLQRMSHRSLNLPNVKQLISSQHGYVKFVCSLSNKID